MSAGAKRSSVMESNHVLIVRYTAMVSGLNQYVRVGAANIQGT